MRYYKTYTLRISEDEVTNPKLIRFEEKEQEIEDKTVGETTALIQDLKVRREKFPSGDYSISLENLTTARYLYIKADIAITIDFNGDSLPKTLVAGMPSEFWMVFTQLDITTTEDTEITMAWGGD